MKLSTKVRRGFGASCRIANGFIGTRFLSRERARSLVTKFHGISLCHIFFCPKNALHFEPANKPLTQSRLQASSFTSNRRGWYEKDDSVGREESENPTWPVGLSIGPPPASFVLPYLIQTILLSEVSRVRVSRSATSSSASSLIRHVAFPATWHRAVSARAEHH